MTESSPPVAKRSRLLRILPFLATAIGLIAAIHVYVGFRLWVSPALPTPLQNIGWVFFALLVAAIPAAFALRRSGRGGWWAERLSTFSTFWLGASGVVLTITAATDLLRVAAEVALGRSGSALHLHDARVQALAICFLAPLLIAWSMWNANGRFVVERVRVPISRLGAAFEGLRIVQISDLHVGDRLGLDFVRRVVDRVNALRPDLIAVTGDLVDGAVEKTAHKLLPLAELRAPLGVYYVTGNHEYYWDGPAWESEVRKLGLTVLRNEHRVLRRGGAALVVAGLPDLQGAAFAGDHVPLPELAFRGAPEDVPRLLLAHQPRAAELVSAEHVDLQLSGHTHGGQIFPFSLLVRLQQPVVQGLRKLFGTWVYTHRGTGFWGPPMRLGAAPEIAEITLTAA